MRSILLLASLLFAGMLREAAAQSGISFNQSFVAGESLSIPTHLQFGPDNRLYVSDQFGYVYIYTIRKNAPNNYEITATETLNIVQRLPNRDDRGNIVNVYNRQMTGMFVTGTANNVIIYATSSDPRIGGGGDHGDVDLDTNSGMLHKLTKSGGNWNITHVVRGLPRAEENHAPNGILIDPATNLMYLAQGGNTNGGSPSNNFAYLTEYALSGAVLTINLNQIDSQFGGSYTLPTLDDPTRANNPDGSDTNDPFGGNDGLNQAKLVPGGPVQIFSTGYRNIYDIVMTKTPGKSGRIYTVDNGANAGWGGFPENENTPNVTNNRLTGEPGSTTPTMNDAAVNNLDNLHYVTQGSYGGHPNPIRANPSGAGLYWFDNATNVGHYDLHPTVDWPPVPVSMAHPIESDFRNPGVNDGALWVTPYSTNGIAEYTASNFNGAMKGNLLAASFMGNTIVRLEMNAAGTAVTNATDIFSGFGEYPLDVIAQGDNDVFPGTIWALTYSEANIIVFEPIDGGVNCTGDINSFTLDDDGDSYSNGDETLNGTNPCSPASKPADFDLDHVSNLRDADDDNDGLSDIVDKFAWDATNGMTTPLPVDYPFTNGNPGTGFFGVGATGLMSNNVDNYAAQYDPNDPALVVGGAVGAFSVPAPIGDATTNNQKYAFQLGVPISASVNTFTMQTRLLGAPFFNGATGAGLGTQSQGFYFGTGDQNNYFKFVFHANNGNPGFQILCEQNGVIVNQQMIPVAGIISRTEIDLFIDVNVLTGQVQCRYQTTGNAVNIGQPFTVSGNLLTLLQSHTNAVATGLISSAGNKTTFSATWDFLKITPNASTGNAAPFIAQAYGNQSVPSTQSTLVVPLNTIFGDDGGVTNLNFSVPSNTNAALVSSSPISNGVLTLNLSGATGTGTITLRATDVGGLSTNTTFQLTVTGGTATLTNIIRINAGGGAQTYGAETWVADQYFTGGSTYFFGADIANTTSDAIYQAERLGNFSYHIPVTGAGLYAVDLHFAEIYFTTTGKRIFNINVENGQFVRNNFDIVATGGSFTALTIRADNINVTDGFVDITLTTILDNAKISGISIGKYSTGAQNAPPFIAQAYGNQSVPSTQSTLVVPLNTIFGDDGGVANLNFSVPSNTNAGLVSSSPISNGVLTLNLSGATGTGTITLRATDVGGLSTNTTFQLTVTGGTATLTNIIRINAGGGAQTYGAETWVADQYFTGGSTYIFGADIANTTSDAVYQAERLGNFSYHIPVSGTGLYAVDLHFAEIYFTTTGKRIFNINVENGQFVRNNLDIVATGGSFTALTIRADNINVTDGFVDITLTTILDNAKISGISIGKYSTGAQNVAPFIAQAYGNQSVPSTQSTLVVPLNTIFGDDGGVANLNFSVPSNTNAGLVSSSPISNGVLTLNLSGATGTGIITLRATDAGGLSTNTTFQLTVTGGTTTLTNVVRINAGGGAQTFGAETWVADQYFTNGFTYAVTSPIANTTSDPVYQSERYGNVSYHIPVTGVGSYAVDLHFAEIYFAAPGMRTFNINVENGQFVRNNLDIFASAGANTALIIRADNINVTDGFVDVSITSVIENAKISGIAVGRYSASGTGRVAMDANTPTIIAPPNTILGVGKSWKHQIIASDPHGEKLTFTAKNLPASLYLDRNTGVISGTIESNSGVWPVTLKVSNKSGITNEAPFLLTITDQVYKQGEIEFILYPNPAERAFSVKLESKENEIWSFVLTDVVGKPVDLGMHQLHEGINVIDFDLKLHNLNSGMYFMDVRTKRGKKTIKVALK